jgi:hypothetical protein
MLGLLPYDDDQVDDDDEDLSEVKKEPKGNKRISKHQGATAAQNADDLYLETIHHPSRLGYHRYMCVLCTYYACVCVGLRQWGETRKRINGIERRGERKREKTTCTTRVKDKTKWAHMEIYHQPANNRATCPSLFDVG